MYSKIKIILTILSFSLFSTIVIAEDISEAELRAAFSGKTVEGRHNKKNFSFKRYYNPNGTLYGESSRMGNRVGKWSVSDSKLCEQWAGKKLKCRDVERHGNKIRKYNDDDQRVVTYKMFITGNTLSSHSTSTVDKAGLSSKDAKVQSSTLNTITEKNEPPEQIVAFFLERRLKAITVKRILNLCVFSRPTEEYWK